MGYVGLVFQQSIRSQREHLEAGDVVGAFTVPGMARFAGREMQQRLPWSNPTFTRCRMAGISLTEGFTASLPDVSQKKDLPEGSMGSRIRAANAIQSDIDQELLEEQIV